MTHAAHGSGPWKGLGALIALLSLVVGVLSPPGFMMAARGGAPTVIICTGHGPAAMPMGQAGSGQHHGGKSSHGGVCPFAGHGLTTAPPTMAGVVQATIALEAGSARREVDLAPGRGLAAPPPPSRGPPLLI
jgi:hypothetical protein